MLPPGTLSPGQLLSIQETGSLLLHGCGARSYSRILAWVPGTSYSCCTSWGRACSQPYGSLIDSMHGRPAWLILKYTLQNTLHCAACVQGIQQGTEGSGSTAASALPLGAFLNPKPLDDIQHGNVKKALDGKKAALVEALQTKLAIHLEAAEASTSEVHPLPHAQHAPWLRG